MKKQLLWTLTFFAFIAISLSTHGASVPSGYSYNTLVGSGVGQVGAIAVDTSTGEIFLATASNQVYKINPDASVAHIASNPWSATGSAFVADVTDIDVIQGGGDLLLGGYQGSNGTITRLDRSTYTPYLDFSFNNGGLYTGLAIDNSTNTMYMTDGYGSSNLLYSSTTATGDGATPVNSVSNYACSLEMMQGTSTLVYHEYQARSLSWYDLTTGATITKTLASMGMGGSCTGNIAINPLTNDIYIPYGTTIVKIAPDGSSYSTFATGLINNWYIDLAFGPSILAGQSWEWSLYGTLGYAGQVFEIGGFGGSNPVPTPSVAWLLCVGLGGIFGIRKKIIKI